MPSLNWTTAWEGWKLVLIGIGSIALIGFLTAYSGSVFLSTLITAIIGITVILYRKGSES